MPSKIMTVLFADLVGSTSLYQKKGDAGAHQIVIDSLQSMQKVIERCGGELLKTVGDEVLAVFDDANSAYLAAVGIQEEHLSLTLSVRVGFHHGEVILDTGDIYGNAVNLASRVAAFAQGDEICTTESAVAQLSSKYKALAHHLDSVQFKGVNEPMSVYRVQWKQDSSETTIIASIGHVKQEETRMVLDLVSDGESVRVDADNPVVTLGRSLNNGIVVNSESTSRTHAKVERVRGYFVLYDSSINGTYILRGNMPQEFVRRESVTLSESGRIGLGFVPEQGEEHVIKFTVRTAK